MRVLGNPILLRMTVVLVIAAAAFVIGFVLIRRMRRNLIQEASFSDDPPSTESFPLHTYHAVIQQLKQQKHELQSTQQLERRRAKTSENISAAVLSNLSCGVVFFSPNGLIRQANAAARQILGFASPVGMGVPEVFRNAALVGPAGSSATLADAVQASLRDRTSPRHLNAWYYTPAGEERMLDCTLTPVQAPDGSVLGMACLINDQTELSKIRRQQEMRGEMSAEMALKLRNSLATISGYAQQLAGAHDPELARQVAADITAEIAHLDRTIGGFLVDARLAKAASGVQY